MHCHARQKAPVVAKRFVQRAFSAAAIVLLPLPAMANTTTVFSPDVKEDTSALEYRSSYVPSDGDERSAFAHRLHYQRAINDTWRWRLIGQQNRRGDRACDFEHGERGQNRQRDQAKPDDAQRLRGGSVGPVRRVNHGRPASSV